MAMPLHRRGAMTTQMTPRRRNPKGGRHFAGARFNDVVALESHRRGPGAGLQRAGHDARIHFSAAC